MYSQLIMEGLKTLNLGQAVDKNSLTINPNGVYRYFSHVIKAEVRPGTVLLTDQDDDGVRRTTIIYYNKYHVVVKRSNKNGAFKQLKPRYSQAGRNCLSLNINNSNVQIGALIRGAHEIVSGNLISDGLEYNHHLAGGLWLPEVFGPETGSFCSPEQNKIHWILVKRILNECKLYVSLPSYHPEAYKLLGSENLKKEDVLNLPHIDRGQYIEII